MTLPAPGTPTLDQLRLFLTVVETGSFAETGRTLGRATSAVSYGIANLEAQLGVSLFERRGARRPALTEAGRAILPDVRSIAMGLEGLRAKTVGLKGGLERELSLVVDVMFPTDRLVAALDAFRAQFPTVDLRLHLETLGAVAQRVLDGAATVGISGPLLRTPDGLDRRQIGAVVLVPVAAPGHPLAAIDGPVSEQIARAHTQLVLTDRSRLTEGQDFAVLALRTWRLADLGAKHALLLAGLGWGNMPEALVAPDIAAGRLKRLTVEGLENIAYGLAALNRTAAPPGPAGAWMVAHLARA